MIRAALPLILLALSACSDRDATGTDGSESDFASRVGAGAGAGTSTASAPSGPMATTAAKGPPPAGANVFAMEQLGDISGVNLGPRAGGCTFSDAGKEMLIAAAPADRNLPGKGVVRLGGRLIQLDTPPGGIDAVRAGTDFNGEGFSVRIQPTAPGKATLTVTDAKGVQKTTAGDYVCA